MIFRKGEIKKTNISYEALTEKMRSFLNAESPKLATTLVRFWNAQENVVTYQELINAVEEGYLDESVIQKWQKNYAEFVNKNLAPEWMKAVQLAIIEELSEAFPDFPSDPVLENIEKWAGEHAAEFVTRIVSDQRTAINNLVNYTATTGAMTPQQLARAIRPLVGLTGPQSMANIRYFNTLVSNGMSANNARKKALQYAAKQHRYRAKVIADHELAVANRWGKHYGIKEAQNLGMMGECMKMWLSARDLRVCPACKELDGKKVSMDDYFDYKGTKIFGPDGAHIHCRCVLIYEEV